MTTKAKTTKTTKPRRLNTRNLRAAMHEAMQTTYNLDLYEAYCAGFARATQHNDVADLCMFFDCAHTAAAFGLGLQHGRDRQSLCSLQDVVAAVSSYTSQPTAAKK